jgi:hypothetical protein
MTNRGEMTTEPLPALEITEVFEALEFSRVPLGYAFDIDNQEFSLVEDMLQGLSLMGTVASHRRIRGVNYRLPDRVADLPQGFALLAYPLRDCRFENPPSWLQQGLAYQDTLPWNIKRSAYGQRPHCLVERTWMRVARPKLAAMAETALDLELTDVTFDGEALRFKSGAGTLLLPATGDAWPKSFVVKTVDLAFLSQQRWTMDWVGVDIFAGRLGIGRRTVALASPEMEETSDEPS